MVSQAGGSAQDAAEENSKTSLESGVEKEGSVKFQEHKKNILERPTANKEGGAYRPASKLVSQSWRSQQDAEEDIYEVVKSAFESEWRQSLAEVLMGTVWVKVTPDYRWENITNFRETKVKNQLQHGL